MTQPSPKKSCARLPWHFPFYLQILVAVALGVLVGWLDPALGKSLKPLGDGFIKLIKMIIAPIVFCTVVHGIAAMGDFKKLGRVGFKTLLYFEVISTLALIIGMVVVNLLKPGAGMNINPASLDPALTKSYIESSSHGLRGVDFLLNIIPRTFFDPLAGGDLLQILFIAILTAFAISRMGDHGKPVLRAIYTGSKVFFNIMNVVVKVAPIGVFGAIGFTVGAFGVGALNRLAELMVGFYLTAALFVLLVLGAIARWAGFSIFRFLIYIKEEILLVLGTSSSETALPGLIKKMERLGCAESTVGLVVPTGCSFNLDGTNIYMAMGAIFLAQATNTPLNLGQQIPLLLVAMLTSKGASGVTGAGFIALAATLAAVPSVPLESLALLVGIDRFMSECRSLTNLIGNGVATIAISRWEKEITSETLRQRLAAVPKAGQENVATNL
jgi:aerobic C4-dicarboxylate transport protein